MNILSNDKYIYINLIKLTIFNVFLVICHIFLESLIYIDGVGYKGNGFIIFRIYFFSIVVILFVSSIISGILGLIKKNLAKKIISIFLLCNSIVIFIYMLWSRPDFNESILNKYKLNNFSLNINFSIILIFIFVIFTLILCLINVIPFVINLIKKTKYSIKSGVVNTILFLLNIIVLIFAINF